MQIATDNRLGRVHSIVIFRALQLGDMLCAIPAFRLLRSTYPDAHIALIGLPWCQGFVSRFAHYIDEFIVFPGYPGLPEIEPQPTLIPAFLEEIQRREFDVAIQLHGSGNFVNSIVKLFHAKRTAGFFVPGEYCPDPELFMPWPEGINEINRYLNLMQHLGLPAGDPTLEFPLTALDHQQFNALAAQFDLQNRPYIVIHPGAQLRSRRWPPERFAAVANAIPEHYTIVISGIATEMPLAEAIHTVTHRQVLIVAGKTSLGALAVLLQNARLLICNDTGLSHMAAALRVPSVVICSASDPQRWAPLDHQLHTVIFHEPVSCRPCAYESCPIGHPCALAVTPHTVAIAVSSKLGFEMDFQIPIERSP